MPVRHPEPGCKETNFVKLQKKSGVSGFCLFAVEVLRKPVQVNRQSDTHAVGIYNMPVKACVRTWLALCTLTGRNIPTRSTNFCIVLTCSFEFLRFQLPNKASATHFQNVVLPPCSRSDILRNRLVAWFVQEVGSA